MGNCCSKNEQKFRVVDGRKYHNIDSASYPLPHDEAEVERLTIQHRVFKQFLGRNYYAPVTDLLKAGGAKILDAGCGPGAWTLDMAKEFPQSKFYGVDISPEFIKTSARNVTFFEANILDGLPYADATFDFVFARTLMTAFSVEQWQKIFIPELLRVTRPGGWIEFFDFSFDRCTGSPAYVRLIAGFRKFQKEKGMDSNLAENIPAMLEANGGVTDITKHVYEMRMGKKNDKWEEKAFLESHFEVFDSAVPMLAEVLNITPEHVRALNEAFSVESQTIDSFSYSTQVYARKKPLEAIAR